MNRQTRIALICLFLQGALVGCGQIAAGQPETSQPAATPIPGWEKFEGGGVELWLPDSYEGGDISADLELIIEKLRDLGSDFEQMAKMIEQNQSMYVIWVFDSDVGSSGFLTNVAVTTEKVLSAITLDIFMDAALNQLPDQFQVRERDIVTLGDDQAGRLVLDFAIYEEVVKEVMYIVKEGNTVWVLTFATDAEEFDERLPVFEQSARTFKTQP